MRDTFARCTAGIRSDAVATRGLVHWIPTVLVFDSMIPTPRQICTTKDANLSTEYEATSINVPEWRSMEGWPNR